MGKTYLDLYEVNGLLPSDLRFTEDSKIERSLYKTNGNSNIAIVNSKLYPKNQLWYSVVTDYFKSKNVELICFTAALNGILLIPIDIIKKYNRHSGWKVLKKGRSYYVRCKIRNEKYILYSTDGEDIDVTEFFIKNEAK